MRTKILTIEDVKYFAKQLTAEGLSFHPDGDFNEYINFTNNKPVCEKEGLDIYEIMMEELLIESGLDKIIPLPSKQ